MEIDEKLLEAIALAAELLGTELSKSAVRVFAADLSRYPIAQVLKSLERCRREVKGRLTLSDVIGRFDDGRPGVEEAWAMMPKNQDDSAVWTDEMRQASKVCADHLAAGRMHDAQKAFREKYLELVAEARDNGTPVNWVASEGHAQSGREEAHHEARNRNREANGQSALPFISRYALPEPSRNALSGPINAMDAVVNVIAGSQRGRDLLAEMKRKLQSR